MSNKRLRELYRFPRSAYFFTQYTASFNISWISLESEAIRVLETPPYDDSGCTNSNYITRQNSKVKRGHFEFSLRGNTGLNDWNNGMQLGWILYIKNTNKHEIWYKTVFLFTNEWKVKKEIQNVSTEENNDYSLPKHSSSRGTWRVGCVLVVLCNLCAPFLWKAAYVSRTGWPSVFGSS